MPRDFGKRPTVNGTDVVIASDASTTNARTPTSHATSHQPGGSDAMAVDAAAATGSLRTLGTGALQATAGNDGRLSDTRTPTDATVTNAKVASGAAIDEAKLNLASDAAAGTASRRTIGTGALQAAAGNDSRLSDTRTPTDGTVTNAKVAAGAAIDESKLSLASDAAAGTASRRTIGTGALQATAGNDSRLSDARTPTAHATSHSSGGSDPITHNNLAGLTTGDPHTQYAKKAGDTLTGALVLAGDAAAALNPVSLQQFQTRAWKDLVTAATTGALPTNTRTGNVLTASANGALPAQDGITLAANDSLFVKDEATGANKGIYTVTNAGAAGAAWVLTRRADADTSAKIAAGLIVGIQQGTTLGGKVWRMTNTAAPTLNTTALTFAAVPTDWADLTGKPSTFVPSAHASSHQPGGGDAMAVDAAAATGSLRTIGTGALQAAAGNDSRLSDTRTPTDSTVTDAKVAAGAAIAESKLSLASDAAAGTASRRTIGTGALQACAGNDSRLSDTRTPTDSTVTDAKVAAGAAIAESKLALASDAAAGTASRRTLGTGALQAAAGNDGRFADARTPTAHATSHNLGGSDQIYRYHIIPFSYKGTLAIATGVLRVRVPTVLAPFTVVEVGATVNTVSSSGSIILDVNKALAASLGTVTTLYTTQGNRPTIAASTRDVVATLPDVTSFAAGDHLTVDIDSAGTGAADLVGYVVVRY